MASSPREKFDAAVKVIRGLPKNGSFQPSNEMMLKFYAYYKQATEGPCTSPKPSMWNMVNRKKWEAWSGLGPMERETAMLRYVEELKHIVETMPQTEQVADFVDTLGSFYELIDDNGKDSPLKEGNHPNGSPSMNGEGDENEEHTADISEQVRHSPKDVKRNHVNGRGDNHHENLPHNSQPPVNSDSVTSRDSPLSVPMNGIDVIVDVDEEDESDYEDDEDKEEDKDTEKGHDSSNDTALGSDSDGDEYCDTSDHMEQVIIEPSTSTPAGRRSENRVRFASDVSVADDTGSFVRSGSSYGQSTTARDVSALTLKERLDYWTTNALSRLSPLMQYPGPPSSDSLCVNASYSSLPSMVDAESLAGQSVDDVESAVDADEQFFMENSDMMTCRGGEDDRAGDYGRVPSSSRGAGNAPYRGGRGTGHPGPPGGSGMGRGFFPSGQGGGNPPGWGHGQPMTYVNRQMLTVLMQLQQNMTHINERLIALEMSIRLQREEEAKRAQNKSMWWPFQNLSKKWAAFLILWPCLTPLIISIIQRRQRSSR